MADRKMFFQFSVIIVVSAGLLCCEQTTQKPAATTDPVAFKTTTELIRAIHSGEITSTDLLNRYIDRIQRYNGDINAVVALNIEAARARAVEADKALAQGKSWGPLHGLPMTIKDMIEVIDMPTAAGDLALKDHIPKNNAVAVQRLIDAGAIIFGKTNVPYHGRDYQSYNKVYGTTNNPWDLSRTPGGSSGGATAALAAGLTPLELGSDLGGSLRVPAHYCGVYGHKPTFGIVPRFGHIPPLPGQVSKEQMPVVPLLVCGPLARSAGDLELALEVLTRPGARGSSDRPVELPPPQRQTFSDYRVAVWFADPSPVAKIDGQVLETLQKVVENLRSAGLTVDEKARPGFQLWESIHLRQAIVNQMLAGSLPLNETLAAKQKDQQAKWAEFFESYDVLLAPVAPTVAFAHDHKQPFEYRRLMVNGKKVPMSDNLTWTTMAIVSGLPATVAPVGLSESGLPVGIQIIGAQYEDRTTIDFARGLSELVGGFVIPPGFEN